jgi:pimeloyl-ACP methyl ester carboxylesterase
MKVAAVVLAAALIVAGVLGLNFRRHDLEIMDLGEQTRRIAPGSFLQLPQGMVHYELAGPVDGRAVVFVDGFSVPYYLWDPTFAALREAGFRVLRYDLYGRGLSDRPEVRYDADLFDRQLLDLLNALGINGGSDFVASSMGGAIVATFACRHPERVHRMAWMDPYYASDGGLPLALRSPVWGEYTMATKIAPGLAEAQLADFLHPEKFPDWPDRFRPQMRYQGFRRALLSTLRDYLSADRAADYACVGRMKTPVLLVWGKADRDEPFEKSSSVRAAVPQAQFLAVDDAAHVPFLEHPEIVNPALVAFLR